MELLKAFIWEGWIPVSCDSMEEWICHSPQWQRSPDSGFHPWRHHHSSFLQVCCAKQVNRTHDRAKGNDLENQVTWYLLSYTQILQVWDKAMVEKWWTIPLRGGTIWLTQKEENAGFGWHECKQIVNCPFKVWDYLLFPRDRTMANHYHAMIQSVCDGQNKVPSHIFPCSRSCFTLYTVYIKMYTVYIKIRLKVTLKIKIRKKSNFQDNFKPTNKRQNMCEVILRHRFKNSQREWPRNQITFCVLRK